jgi:hypothetical protein
VVSVTEGNHFDVVRDLEAVKEGTCSASATADKPDLNHVGASSMHRRSRGQYAYSGDPRRNDTGSLYKITARPLGSF